MIEFREVGLGQMQIKRVTILLHALSEGLNFGPTLALAWTKAGLVTIVVPDSVRSADFADSAGLV